MTSAKRRFSGFLSLFFFAIDDQPSPLIPSSSENDGERFQPAHIEIVSILDLAIAESKVGKALLKCSNGDLCLQSGQWSAKTKVGTGTESEMLVIGTAQ